MSAAEGRRPDDQEDPLAKGPELEEAAAAAAEPLRGADDPVLPSQTADDTDNDWRDRDDSGDDHYLRERPPHW